MALHQRAALIARQKGLALNALVTEVPVDYLGRLFDPPGKIGQASPLLHPLFTYWVCQAYFDTGDGRDIGRYAC